jgi:hypothetical protein
VREERERRRQALREEMERHKATCEGCERCAPPRAITAAPGDDVRVSRFRAPAQPTAEQHAAALALLGVGADVPRGEVEPQDERDAAELQAARDEAKRRIAVRDRQAARRAAHEKRVRKRRKHILAAIAERDAAGDGAGQALDDLDKSLLACEPPPEMDDPAVGQPTLSELEAVRRDELEAAQQRLVRIGRKDLAEQLRAAGDSATGTGIVDASALAACDLCILEAIAWERADRAAPPPKIGPPTLSELEAVRQRVDRTGDAALVEQARALCDAARATGTLEASALAASDPRLVAAIAWERTDRARQKRTEPARRAQPGELLDVLTARVLVERGRTPFEAIRLVTGMTYAEAKEDWRTQRVYRAERARKALEAELAAPPEGEMSPELVAELERVLAELERAGEQ